MTHRGPIGKPAGSVDENHHVVGSDGSFNDRCNAFNSDMKSWTIEMLSATLIFFRAKRRCEARASTMIVGSPRAVI